MCSPRLKRAVFFFSSRRRHTRYWGDWSSDVGSPDLTPVAQMAAAPPEVEPDGQAHPPPESEGVYVEQAKSDKIPRNAPCPCGSGKKYKQCHGRPGAVSL